MSNQDTRRTMLRSSACGAVALFAFLAADARVIAAGPAEAPQSFVPGEPVTRRLTMDQYRNIIGDVFGPAVDLGGRFDPDVRVDGLLEVGSAKVSVSASGMEQYDAIARAVASQVLDEAHRDMVMPCKPRDVAEADDQCAALFLSDIGQLLFRRPLTAEEQKAFVGAARASTAPVKNFYTGLSLALANMLESPQFLFRGESVERDPEVKGGYRLDAYAKASRLSFFLWNTLPDPILIAAAQKGELDSAKGIRKQVDRMLGSPRLEAGVRAFFSDMFGFDEIKSLVKDDAIYPKFTTVAAEDSEEQTLKTVVDLLLTRNGDYRDIFTTKKTFLTQELASIYRVPLPNPVPNGSPDTWQPFEFAADDPRAGILMEASFVALHSHPGRSSPTLRGKAIREIMLCQRVPPPPGDVKFDIVQDTSNPVYKTARDRLNAHGANPVCAGCHKIIDPMGFALENFDGGGAYRTAENGVRIDTSGVLDGVKFQNGMELGKAIHDSPAASSCLVDRVSAYALGRTPAQGEGAWVSALKQGFAADGYRLPALMRRIATSPEFFRVTPPKGGELTKTTLRETPDTSNGRSRR